MKQERPLAFLLFASAALLGAACPRPAAALPASGPDGRADSLVAMINTYRAAPGSCAGRAFAPVAPLQAHPALSRVRIGPATFIENALQGAGYAAEQAEVVSVTGPDDARAAMNVIQEKYCSVLLSTRFSAVGSYREGKEWTVVLARPAPPLPSSTFPDWRDAGKAILEGVNAARASGHTCGGKHFPPAPPVSWNPALGQAALGHSQDMAARRYFSHKAKDGSMASERAQRAGYHWQRVGENIAFGQHTPAEAVAGWLDSPGHCANIMNASFTEMGAAYGIAAEQRTGIIYWTQVFGRPR
ncbi:CAP domain-containing protein [Massilia sp. ST3]|uniref:CAP domain-containing protein n=1 Tax=Massilia sp. ST3 TaxID=2824903 RepID=UPI001E41A16B|nr:CAP domain-containing protein [Massilia sp. ST3]